MVVLQEQKHIEVDEEKITDHLHSSLVVLLNQLHDKKYVVFIIDILHSEIFTLVKVQDRPSSNLKNGYYHLHTTGTVLKKSSCLQFHL